MTVKFDKDKNMKLKIIILIFNVIYLIVAIIWAIIDKSFETILAIIGGAISVTTFFVANDNSFSIKKKQNINNKNASIEKQNNVQGNYYEYNQ